MTKKEVISEIRKMTKPYISLGMSQSTFSITLRNIELGICKPKTELAFFKKIGVTVKSETVYEIKPFDPIGR